LRVEQDLLNIDLPRNNEYGIPNENHIFSIDFSVVYFRQA